MVHARERGAEESASEIRRIRRSSTLVTGLNPLVLTNAVNRGNEVDGEDGMYTVLSLFLPLPPPRYAGCSREFLAGVERNEFFGD